MITSFETHSPVATVAAVGTLGDEPADQLAQKLASALEKVLAVSLNLDQGALKVAEIHITSPEGLVVLVAPKEREVIAKAFYNALAAYATPETLH